MELWLEESRKRDEGQQQEEVHRELERRLYKKKWGRWKEEERRQIEEVRSRWSEKIMRTLATSLTELERRRRRTEFGVDSLKLPKLTLSDDIEAFIMAFERSMEAHKIECTK